MVEDLYADSGVPSRAEWRLIVQLYESGESICLLYEPRDGWREFVAVKGATHPVDAAEGTIRASFWCDNGICNLVHMSDNPGVTAHQLRIAGFEKSLASLDLPLQQEHVNHSGIVMLLRLIRRFARLGGDTDTPRTFDAARKALHDLITSRVIENLAAAYFDADRETFLAALEPFGASEWENFVLQCGMASVGRWINKETRTTDESVRFPNAKRC